MWSVDRDMLPMKGHYFTFNAGTAPLVPYLATYAKQLGFTTSIVGLIYTILPILGLIVKPLFGAIGDRYHKHKFIFIFFQAVTIAGFAGLYFIPTTNITTVEFSCGDGETFLHSKYENSSKSEACNTKYFVSDEKYADCNMECEINTPYMWQTICEHWKLPQYCYNIKSEFSFTSVIPKRLISTDNGCIHFHINQTVMIDDVVATPKCQYVPEQTIECSVYCPDKRFELVSPLNSNKMFDLKCDKNGTHFSSCDHSLSETKEFVDSFNKESGDVNCSTKCHFKKLIQWAHICDGWKADASEQCKGNTNINTTHIDFIGIINLEKTFEDWPYVYFKVDRIEKNRVYHYPTCPSVNSSSPHFKTICDAKCTNAKMNDIIRSSNVSEDFSHATFWPFFLFMCLNWIGMAVVVSIADAICFAKLGDKPHLYGQQRLWGSLGWGIFSLVAGVLIDKYSNGSEEKDYTLAFLLMFIFLSLDILISYYLRYSQKKLSVNVFSKIGILFSSRQTIHFFIWTVFVGMCTGLQWQFLFWYLEDLATSNGCDFTWIKTLQGLAGSIQCFGGELPFFFLSGIILNKIGHVNSMTLVLMGFGLRFVLYSILSNPWWVLPIELFQGLTFGMLYTTMASYAALISPPGIEATAMGLVGAVFEGVGTSLGSLISGKVYSNIGGAMTFRIFGCISLVLCLINLVLVSCKVIENSPKKEPHYVSVVHSGDDFVKIIGNDHSENDASKR